MSNCTSTQTVWEVICMIEVRLNARNQLSVLRINCKASIFLLADTVMCIYVVDLHFGELRIVF